MLSSLLLSACSGESTEPNLVDPQQINVDGSSNYREIFREKIQSEDEKINRYKKNEFK